jgi:hypothetical protein
LLLVVGVVVVVVVGAVVVGPARGSVMGEMLK